jgi:ABC-2 type transport system permease protein
VTTGTEPVGTTVGTGTLLRFMLRRERLAFPLWVLGTAFLFTYQSVGSQSLYDTDQKLARLRETLGGNAAVIAMSGPEDLVQTIGGEITFEIFAYTAIVVALMSMFLVGRHTRSDEEAGRGELLRSARVGRHATLLAAVSLAAIANVTTGLLIFLGGVGTGLPVTGSLIVALATVGVGLTFTALAAVAVQLFENPRSVYGSVALLLGAAQVLRGAGDVGNGALSWASPIGWGQRTFPYVEDRWWPLLLPVAATLVLSVVAVALLDRRDFGAGLVPARPGRASASWSLGTPLGLAWRLQRGSLIGWGLGLFALGAAYGSVGESIEDYLQDNPEVAEFFPGGKADIVDAYLSVTLLITVLISTAFGVTAVLRVRKEESSMHAEPVLATATSRWAYLGSHVMIAMVGNALLVLACGFGIGLSYGATVSDGGQIPRIMAQSLTYVPAVWMLVGIAALAVGLLPRIAAAVAWTAFGYILFIGFLGDALDLPDGLVDASPFSHTPAVPLEDVTAGPLLAIGAIAAVLLATGFAGFRRRDIVT